MRALIPVLVLAFALPVTAAPAAAQDDAEPTYLLPAPAGQALLVSGNQTRRGDERFAVDFEAAAVPATDLEEESEPAAVDPAFTVVASRGGTVIGQRSSVPDGRCPRRSIRLASRLLAAGRLRPHRPRRRNERAVSPPAARVGARRPR